MSRGPLIILSNEITLPLLGKGPDNNIIDPQNKRISNTTTFQTSTPPPGSDVIASVMGATEPEVERESEEKGERENDKKKEEEDEGDGNGEGEGRTDEEEEEEEEEENDEEKGEVATVQEKVMVERSDHVSMLQRLNPTNPLRIVVNGGARVATPSPAQPFHPPQRSSRSRSTPTPQQTLSSLNSTKYTDKISLFLFVLHVIIAIALVCFLVFKGIQGLIGSATSVKRKEQRLLTHFLPQVEAASLLSITLAFAWQKAVRTWPTIMVRAIPWSSFIMSFSAGLLLICLQRPPTDGVGACFVVFAIGSGLYACWVNPRTKFCCKVLVKSLEPVSKFPDLNHPTYWVLGVGFMWMSLWILAVIGALNFYFPPLVIILMVLSLAWIAEVMKNVANLTVSRVIALYYLRGMQSSTRFCFHRALTRNLGSACLGSLFVPTIEALRIVARVLNLLEGEDEFMFSCAHCCLRVMESIFSYGNGWAYVQIAAYGKGFVRASQDTWALIERRGMQTIVDSDITSAICFLTGVCSGSICVIVVAAWTTTVYQPFTATLSLLAFCIGYLMTRISMALPHACVSCYYVCYAENPENRFFDKTIEDHQNLIKQGRDVVVPTPRVPRMFRT